MTQTPLNPARRAFVAGAAVAAAEQERLHVIVVAVNIVIVIPAVVLLVGAVGTKSGEKK